MIDCPHAARCPGCALIGLPLAEQLVVKAQRLTTAFAAYAADDGTDATDTTSDALDPTSIRVADPDFGYRTRAKLAVAAGGRLGLFAAETHEVIDLPDCQVLAPVLARAANAIRAILAAPPSAAAKLFRGVPDDLVPAGDAPGPAGRLRAIDLREVRDHSGVGVLLTLVVDSPLPSAPELEAACDALEQAIPELRTVALSQHDGRSPQLLGRTPVALRGEALQPERSSPDEPFHYVSIGSFAQAHRGQAAAILREVVQVLAPAPPQRILEVFAGSGALGLALAARGAAVTLVESFAPALDAALRAAREQSLEAQLTVRVGPAERELPRLVAEAARFDAAIVNPPRRGVAPSARAALAKLCAGRLVYISCEPETLARDLAHLALLGWRTVSRVPFDMMPQTREIECMFVLERGARPKLSLLYEDDELIAVAKPPYLPLISDRAGDDSLLERLRATAPLAEPVHTLDPDASGVCLFVKSSEFAADWRAALASPSARKHYLALVRGHARGKGRIARALADEDALEHAAVTRYRRLEAPGGHSLLEVTPESDRRHQILRHLAGIGRPVLGDERYGHMASNRHLAERYWLDRPFLHCASTTLPHPRTGATLKIESPLAPDLAAVLARLRDSRARPPFPAERRKSRRLGA